MKISQKDLENVIKEEVGGALEEGPFSTAFNKAMQGLKTRNIAKQDKQMGIQRTTVKPEKQQSIDKFMDNKTKKAVVRISAEILSDPSVKLDKTKALKRIDPESIGTEKGRSKGDIFREEEQLNEATPKEIRFYSKLINQAIEDKKMTLEDLLDDVLSLADTNPVVNAIAGVEDLKRFKQKAQPEAPTNELPQGEKIKVPRTGGGESQGVSITDQNISQLQVSGKLKQQIKNAISQGNTVAAFIDGEKGLAVKNLGPSGPQKNKLSSDQFANFMAANQPQDPKRPTKVPDTTGAPTAKEISPEQEEKAKQAADNIMSAIAGAIDSAPMHKKAKGKARRAVSTEKIRQAIGREIRAGLQEQKDRWQKLAGILKD